ncbi:hypothetical protein DPMN_137368 [Dreissena polymorpha]|uniref:Uncharacterized protein n=1 Tax=Dreissena polymorpha TaxID=45954 RepID=A0A9D4G1P3_DREPO|nr:hypothetical protein DPMN_137368 [Dreissena polymorpha]
MQYVIRQSERLFPDFRRWRLPDAISGRLYGPSRLCVPYECVCPVIPRTAMRNADLMET